MFRKGNVLLKNVLSVKKYFVKIQIHLEEAHYSLTRYNTFLNIKVIKKIMLAAESCVVSNYINHETISL